MLGRQSDSEKALEILLLRRQLAILQRQQTTVIRPTRPAKFILAVLTVKLKTRLGRTVTGLREVIHIVQPETVLKWHRELVKWKWRQKPAGGRPRTSTELEQLVVRLARENDWGYGKIQGELKKLGHALSTETIRNILKRHGIPPTRERANSLSWQQLCCFRYS